MKHPQFSDYIKVYDDMGLEEFSDECIELFINNIDRIQNHDADWRRCQIYTGIDTHFTMFEELKDIIRRVIDRYKKEIGNNNLHFLKCIEAPNIIAYHPDDPEGKNHFHSHSDNWSMETASRQLSIILYLNDVEEGGVTTFTDLGLSVKPKRGRILVFPSFYTYPHKGEPPVSNSKYILVSWIHFGGKGHSYRVHDLY